MTNTKRQIEIFSAGCSVCEPVVERVKALACPSCDVLVVDMKSRDGESRARELGVNSIPAVAIDGKLADCCSSRGIDEDVLRAAGLGQALS